MPLLLRADFCERDILPPNFMIFVRMDNKSSDKEFAKVIKSPKLGRDTCSIYDKYPLSIWSKRSLFSFPLKTSVINGDLANCIETEDEMNESEKYSDILSIV